ncbi:AAA family ATPase [Desulfobacterales bacterium HSG16]|nr:AAA family ATPase [Desulfobacterales bacterium HSG16]
MQIQRIQIKNLFGMFDHDINLKIKDRITIIHGPNGIGKTTVLKLLKEIFDIRFCALQPVPFLEIIITFVNQYKLHLQKKDTGDMILTLKEGDETLIEHEMNISILNKQTGEHKIGPKDFMSHLDRVGPNKWYDKSTGDTIFETDGSHGVPIETIIKKPPKKIEKILKDFRTYFLETQRLTTSSSKDYDNHDLKTKILNNVEKYSIEMTEILQEAIKESASIAASLDRTFPHRLFKSELPENANEIEIRKRYQNQSSYRQRLMKAGLLEVLEEEESVSLPDGNLESNDLKFLWYYISDMDTKLEVFSPLLKKIELFKDIINSRLLYKSFSIEKSEGFVFLSDNGEKIPPKTLSSGEQHEIVLAYELIFKVEKKSFIMIDEPELSLHVTWQHKLLSDLERISKLVDLDFLIATHSPSIVHDRRSLMVALEKESDHA